MAELTRDDLLTLLIEECSEVIQAVTKCQRFGYDRDQPGYGINSEVLFGEMGDVLGVIDALAEQNSNVGLMMRRRSKKIAKATRVKTMIENESMPQPLAAYE